MNFFTADLHFSHRNIIRFDDRPFQDLPSMHAELSSAGTALSLRAITFMSLAICSGTRPKLL